MNNVFNRFLIIACLLVLIYPSASGQSTNFEPGSPVYTILDRMEMKSGKLSNQLFLDIQPVQRDQVTKDIFLAKDSGQLNLSKTDRYWLQYLEDENLPFSGGNWKSSKNPLIALKNSTGGISHLFYESKANFYEFLTKDSAFEVFINPVLAFGLAKEKDSSAYRYRNSRGIEIRGCIDKHIGFYTYLTDNQVVLPGYVQNFVTQYGVLPGEGYWKPFKSNGYDYFTARGYFTFSPEKHIHFQFGNTQAFIGNGYRSLLLSDFAQNYLNLTVTARVWRFQYQNIFAEMTDDSFKVSPYPRKYAAFHYLTFDAAKFLNIGVFEGIMFYDVQHNGRGFDFSYLNPVIFYRSVEQNNGSPDNALVGANINILPCKNVRLYGQFLLDEFEVHEFFSSKGWWGNKYGVQAGIKYIDVLGIHNFDLQGELNIVRPYTYSEKNPSENYSTYAQPLADPLGANFRELIGILRYNPAGPLDFKLKLFYIQQGKDSGVMDYGSNIFMSYNLRPADYGIQLLQGVLTNTIIADLTVSYQLRHNLFIDLNALYRSAKSPLYVNARTTTYAGIGIRLNFMEHNYDF